MLYIRMLMYCKKIYAKEDEIMHAAPADSKTKDLKTRKTHDI